MKNLIQQKISEIEKERNIQILFASESGSRGWGFPSPNSDYDVRFIYLKEKDWYLKVSDKRKDSMEFPINDDLDICGWEIRKSLQLLRKSNASLFEWLQSPIVYFSNEKIKNELWKLCEYYFNPRTMTYHYLSITKTSLANGLVGEQFNIKKYFYVLRPLLAAKWILENNTIPPMEFQPLLTLLHDNNLKKEIDILLKKKAEAMEGEMTPINKVIHNFIHKELERCEELVKTCPNNQTDSTKVDELLRNLFYNYAK